MVAVRRQDKHEGRERAWVRTCALACIGEMRERNHGTFPPTLLELEQIAASLGFAVHYISRELLPDSRTDHTNWRILIQEGKTERIHAQLVHEIAEAMLRLETVAAPYALNAEEAGRAYHAVAQHVEGLTAADIAREKRRLLADISERQQRASCAREEVRAIGAALVAWAEGKAPAVTSDLARGRRLYEACLLEQERIADSKARLASFGGA